MTIFDATQVLLQAPWAHCFARTPFPVLCVLRASCLLSLNLFTFALINEELKKGVFRAMGSGDVDPFTSTCLQGTHPSPALWTLVKPRHNPQISGSRQWCSTCGTWALRQDSCFSALSTHPHSNNLSQRLKPLQEGCLRCGGLFGAWERAPPSPSFSKPPLLSGPRFFLQFEDDDEEVIASQDTMGQGWTLPRLRGIMGQLGSSRPNLQGPSPLEKMAAKLAELRGHDRLLELGGRLEAALGSWLARVRRHASVSSVIRHPRATHGPSRVAG